MTDLTPRALKQRSRQNLAPLLPEARRVVIVYTAVLAALALGSNGLQLYLSSQISETGGLSGLGLRSVLQTIQEFLTYVNIFFDPFWSAGFLCAMLAAVRGRRPRAADLCSGFRKGFKIIGYLVFQLLVFILLTTLVAQISSMVFLMSSAGEAFYEIMEPLLSDPELVTAEGLLNTELLPLDTLAPTMMPMFAIFGLIFLPLYTWLNYNFRLAMYLIAADNVGGAAAHLLSARLMKGHKWEILKLDLSYWWYYLLGVVITLAGWLDILLPLVGVELPFDPTLMYFATLILHCVLLLALNVWKKCEVECTYLTAFEAIVHPAEEAIADSSTEL